MNYVSDERLNIIINIVQKGHLIIMFVCIRLFAVSDHGFLLNFKIKFISFDASNFIFYKTLNFSLLFSKIKPKQNNVTFSLAG